MDFSIFKRVKQKYRQIYRFVIMDDATFEEKVVLRLTPRLFVVLFISISVLLIVLTISLVAFTPLREYIPGYGSEENRKKMILLKNQTDSLQKLISEITVYERDVKTVFINGRFKDDTVDLEQKIDYSNEKNKFAFSEYDSILIAAEIKKAAAKRKITHIKPQKQKRSDLFFMPANGIVIQKYTAELKGIKIASDRETSVFSILEGTVIYVGYGLETGTCILILHPNNIVTIYQHAGRPAVQTGDYVKPKQAISTIDSDMPLVFGLWINGGFVNPEEYILFSEK